MSRIGGPLPDSNGDRSITANGQGLWKITACQSLQLRNKCSVHRSRVPGQPANGVQDYRGKLEMHLVVIEGRIIPEFLDF